MRISGAAGDLGSWWRMVGRIEVFHAVELAG